MGERRHWLSSYYPVRADDGEVIGIGARDHGDHRPQAGRRPAAPARRGRRALLDLARAGRDRVADRPGGRARGSRTPATSISPQGDVLERVACAHADPERSRCARVAAEPFALGRRRRRRSRSVVVSGRAAAAAHDLEPSTSRSSSGSALDRRRSTAIGTHSLMLVPIVARGETLGVITLGSRQPGRFDEHDLDLAQELAGRAGVAIDNARLVGELRRRAQAAQALEFVGDGVFLVDGEGVTSGSGTRRRCGSPASRRRRWSARPPSRRSPAGRSARASGRRRSRSRGRTASSGSR